MRIVGLTGGIASGKSTVSRMLADLGATVIDADVLAREIVMPGQPAYDEIVREFGTKVLLPDRTLNRKQLGDLVFGNREMRAKLNAITHPRVFARTAERMAELKNQGIEVAVYDVPLLVENSLHKALQGVIVVSIPRDLQVLRLLARDGLSADEANARIDAQLPLTEKLRVADYVVDNSLDLASTRNQTAEIWQDILEGGPRKSDESQKPKQ